MIDRPLFNKPMAPATRQPKRRVKAPPKPPAPSWTIVFTAAPGNDAPPVCRIRMLLKSAWRRHHLKARVIAGPGDAATAGEPTGNKSSDGPRGPQIAFNEAKMARLVALRDKIATLAASLRENQ